MNGISPLVHQFGAYRYSTRSMTTFRPARIPNTTAMWVGLILLASWICHFFSVTTRELLKIGNIQVRLVVFVTRNLAGIYFFHVNDATPRNKTRLWFQIFFMFIPTWGRFPFWRAYFSDGLVQPPTRKTKKDGPETSASLDVNFTIFFLAFLWRTDQGSDACLYSFDASTLWRLLLESLFLSQWNLGRFHIKT